MTCFNVIFSFRFSCKMSLIHQVRAKKKREEKLEKSNNLQPEEDSSPVRTVLGSLGGDTSIHSRKGSMVVAKEVVTTNRKREDKRPQRIEEVPFR